MSHSEYYRVIELKRHAAGRHAGRPLQKIVIAGAHLCVRPLSDTAKHQHLR